MGRKKTRVIYRKINTIKLNKTYIYENHLLLKMVHCLIHHLTFWHIVYNIEMNEKEERAIYSPT